MNTSLPLRFRFARWVMKHRLGVLIVFGILTAVSLIALPNVVLKTVFKNMLPKDDPFVQVYYDHPNFGSPLTMYIMVKRKGGDIYHQDTLQKVWDMTREVDLAPAIDHDQLISISTEKLRYVEATPEGADIRPLMGDAVPATPEEVADFRRKVEQSPNARNFFVSRDHTATLIQATFQDYIEYGEAFDFVRGVIDKHSDDKHEIYLAGQPVLTGWIYQLQTQTYGIFIATLCILLLLLLLYMRNLTGVLTPAICAVVAALWGIGFIGWMEKPIEPLLTIIPLLLVARSLSHGIQYTERYYEVLAHLRDKKAAAEVTLGVMMVPSALGIATDFLGIAFIAVAPIVMMREHALFAGSWALWILPTGTVLASILLSYLPIPRNVDAITGGQGGEERGMHGVQKQLLRRLSMLCQGRAARLTTVVIVASTLWAIHGTLSIKVGNPVEGSNLLWQDSEFNTAVRAINRHFPGMNTLELIIESKAPDDAANRVATLPEVMRIRTELQDLVEASPLIQPRATLSFSDYMMEGNRLFSGGNPLWLPVEENRRAAYSAAQAVLFGSSPVNFGHVMDFVAQNSTVSIWFADNKQETVEAAIASARQAVQTVGEDHELFRVRMASGFIALQQAMNIVVQRYHWFIFLLLNAAIALVAWIAYRSIVASFVLLVPVNLANVLQTAAMYHLGIGLDINATIVAVLGVGIGIDYGIYLLSRICEEYHVHQGDLGAAITSSMTTTGKAIMFTASIMFIGISPWMVLSDLKFMADMGTLLMVIMLANMVLSLVVLPLVVYLVNPGFLRRTDLAVGENVDLSLFMVANRV